MGMVLSGACSSGTGCNPFGGSNATSGCAQMGSHSSGEQSRDVGGTTVNGAQGIASRPVMFGNRQILPDFEADPSARVWGDELWIYPSHDVAGSKYWDMVDWHAFSSTDLIHWTDHGTVFQLSDLTWANRYAWAPDCIHRNGKYYFYFPADDQIGVAVSDKPEGHFHDALGQPLIARNEGGTRAIDPNIFIDDDGQAYLFYGQNALRAVKIREDMITRDGPIVSVPLEKFHEGIWIHKRNGIYYLSYPSSDGTNASKLEYSMGKTILGPFEYKGSLIDNNSRNIHGSITEFHGHWYLFYHIQGPSPYERRVCMTPLVFLPDGTMQPIGLATPQLLTNDNG
jgi:arabinoxylan arabinofuranohydrolase